MSALALEASLVSVVIAANNAEAVIVECLTRLQQQGEPSKLQIIVADGSTDATPQLVQSRFPSVKLLHFETPETLSVLRARAIALARGHIIAVLDPYSMVSEDWLEQLLEAHARHEHAVIGGAVDLYREDTCGMLAWAQYLNEYGMFMSPLTSGAMEILPGSNISYKRDILFDGDKPRFPEFWKTFVNAKQRQSGNPLWQVPSLRVALWKPIKFGDFLRTRFTHGRCYAGMRCADSNRAERLLRLLSAPFIPLLLQWRWSRRFWPKQRHRVRFVLSLPLQLMLFGCWSAGEFTGYLAGPGNACRELYY